ncbi:hypothetical protein JXB31_01230 [Candidatus Woesearchaeota archaeon]|nr:hypothetical protein [Candidatus Woesearchaeota archaeon]
MGRRTLFNRKAELAFKQIMFMFARMLILIIIFFSIVYVTKKHIIATSDITDTEIEIMMQSIMSNKNGLIYYDQTIDRAYPHVIDPGKFRSDVPVNLDNVFSFGADQKIIAANITLFDMDGERYMDKNGNPLMSAYINEAYYRTWLDMARSSFIGPGGAVEKTKRYYVHIKEEQGLVPGIVAVSIVMPNS